MGKKTGILCPISMLPNRFGIGDFGESTLQFIDILKEKQIHTWQILPLHPSLQANSPYRAISCYAGDEIYISLDTLYHDGLLPCKAYDFHRSDTRVHYTKIRLYKEYFLKQAFYYFQENDAYRTFITTFPWVKWYAIYKAFCKHNRCYSWRKWSAPYKEYPQDKSINLQKFDHLIRYEMFIQFIFYQQWKKVKSYANKAGISILGDMPFYVDIDSMEVWKTPKAFLLDENKDPTHIAGVPPDYFSETGQMWGNPIYDWTYLSNQQFDFWVSRLSYASQLFDEIRIDHFRAFDTYWKIPASAKTAVEGEWLEAPGYEVLQTILMNIQDITLVAEDLGEIRDEVTILKNHFSIPGMKVFQFQLQDGFASLHNTLLYTGTHDNETIVGWFSGLQKQEQKQILQLLQGETPTDIHLQIIAFCNRVCEYCIFPIWDVLGYDNHARFNIPGHISKNNWTYRLLELSKIEKGLDDMVSFIKKCI